MADRGRYDSAMFWLAFGTAAAVIGLALMTIGVTRSAAGASLLTSVWFDVGLVILGIGGLLLLWALGLYLARRRAAAQAQLTAGEPGAHTDATTEAVRGYYAERARLFGIWERQQKGNRPKK